MILGLNLTKFLKLIVCFLLILLQIILSTEQESKATKTSSKKNATNSWCDKSIISLQTKAKVFY